MKKATISTKKSTLIGTFVKWEDNNDFLGSLYLNNEKTGKIYSGFVRHDNVAIIYSNGTFYGRFKAVIS